MCHSGQGTYECVEFNKQIVMGKFSVESWYTLGILQDLSPKFNAKILIGKEEYFFFHPLVNFASL